MCSTWRGVNEDRVSRPESYSTGLQVFVPCSLVRSIRRFVWKGDAVKESSNRHQRDTKQRDEHAKNAGTEESHIDQTLADSFPASDAPPWTLGVRRALATSGRNKKKQRADGR